MKLSLFTIIISGALISCYDKIAENNKTITDVKTLDSLPPSISGCYQMIISEDTATMKIDEKNNSIEGTLKYKRKDKDSNTGTVILSKSGNRVEGFYTFQSEGQTSVRQIVFKINESALSEAYGDIVMKNDTAVYKYPHALNYEEKHEFNKVNCQ